MNFLRSLLDSARGSAVPEVVRYGDRWYTYEDPKTNGRLRIYNASERKMPLELYVNDAYYALVSPFDGEKNEKKELEVGDWLYRVLTQQERGVLVDHWLRGVKKRHKGSAFALKPDAELKRKRHAELAKMCGCFRIEANG